MNQNHSRRKLTTIFYADVAGYSRLTGQDELGSHQRVMQTLDFASASISQADGKVLRYAGDAILAEFSSVVAAVETAHNIQQELLNRNADLDENDKIQLRIGINLGEVLEDRNEIFGDGVNTAARLEAHCETGGICISSLVQQQISGKTGIAFVDGGEQQFKNISQPVRVFNWPGRHGANPTESPVVPKKPSIAILAFENKSNDPEQEYFAEGISEDIITLLAKFNSIFVIARNSAFSFKGQATDVKEIGRKLGVRYVVEGSVRKAGQRIRITAQLIDAIENKNLWAEHYDRDLEDVFAVQDEVTEAIVTTIEPALISSERQRARSKPTENLNAWENFQRGLWHIYQYTPEDTKKALSFQERAIALDPNYAAAYGAIAFSMYVYLITGMSKDREADMKRGLEAGRTAINLDENDPFAHVGLGRIHIVRGEHDKAIASFDRALSLNPSFALAFYGKAHSLWHCGKAAEAVICHEEAARISPRDPLAWTFLASKAIALALLDRFDESIDCARRGQQYPNHAIWAYLGELCSLGLSGRTDEAGPCLQRALEKLPDLSISFITRALPITDTADREKFIKGLKLAAVPE